jgi:hypothetical protein
MVGGLIEIPPNGNLSFIVALPEMEPRVAVMKAVPEVVAASAVMIPAVTVMVATEVKLDFQVTALVRSLVEPSV